MSEEAKNFYGDYFTRYTQYFSSVVQSESYEKLQDPGIYEIFEGSLLDKHPLALYKYVYGSKPTISIKCSEQLEDGVSGEI